MFENTKSGGIRALIAVTLIDGTLLNLSVKLSLSSKLADTLNNTEAFLDVVDGDGKQSFLAKSAIARVDLIEVPRANQINLFRRSGDNTAFDPYAVLGVARGADPATIREAYYATAKRYHPDRFLSLDMPKEMADYAAAMLVRINLAYEQIGG